MAESKPLKVPRWNDDLTNQTEPPEDKKDEGWVVDDQPDGSFWNWLLFYTGAWFKWFNERHFDGVDEEDYTIYPPDSAGSLGGTMKISGGIGAASSTGGDLEISGGQGGVSAGGGGDTIFRGGDAIASGASGGQCLVRGGNSASSGNGGELFMKGGTTFGVGNGGPITIGGGDATVNGNGAQAELVAGDSSGTDKNGGNALVTAGQPTGDGSSSVSLFAADGDQGPGTSPRGRSEYLKLDGAKRRILVRRAMNIASLSSDPTAPIVNGDLWRRSGRLSPTYYNGTFDQYVFPLAYRLLTPSDDLILSSTDPRTQYEVSSVPLQYDIPANILRQGSIIKIRADVTYEPTIVSTTIFSYWIQGNQIGAISHSGNDLGFFNLDANIIVRLAGVSGKIRANGLIHDRDNNSPTPVQNFYHAVDNITGQDDIDTTAVAAIVLQAQVTAGSNVTHRVNYFTVEII